MVRSLIMLTIGIFSGLILGILLQHFYPIGSLLQKVGLRSVLPISRNLPKANSTLEPSTMDVPAESRGKLLLFILLGQSNMSGRGSLDSPSVPQPHPNIYVFNKDFRWYPAKEPLGTIAREVDPVATDGGTGVGPGLAFALELLKHNPQLKIGLIPCARSATSIEEWQRDLSQNSLYGSCLRRTRAASTYGEVAAVLISQGEADAADPQRYPEMILSPAIWATKFTALINSLRSDLGNPELPIIFTQLGSYGPSMSPEWLMVKQQQAGVHLRNVVMIPTGDLPLAKDIHFSTESQVELGRRFALAYLNLSSEQP